MKSRQLTSPVRSTTITSILRMQTLDFSIKSPDITCKHTPQQHPLATRQQANVHLVDDIDSSIWTMIEINLAIVCACLPVCRLPLAYAFPAYFSSTDSTKNQPAVAMAVVHVTLPQPDTAVPQCRDFRAPSTPSLHFNATPISGTAARILTATTERNPSPNSRLESHILGPLLQLAGSPILMGAPRMALPGGSTWTSSRKWVYVEQEDQVRSNPVPMPTRTAVSAVAVPKAKRARGCLSRQRGGKEKIAKQVFRVPYTMSERILDRELSG